MMKAGFTLGTAAAAVFALAGASQAQPLTPAGQAPAPASTAPGAQSTPAPAPAPALSPAPATAPRISFGIKGGINLASVEAEGSEEGVDSKVGLAAGGFFQYRITPLFSIQPEALFSMKGYEFSAGGESGGLSLSYLEVPVLARANFPVGRKVLPYVYAGPAVAVLLSAEATDDDQSQDVGEVIEDMDLGLVLGGGLAVPMATGAFTFDLRYTLGLTNIFDFPDELGAEADAQNRVFSLLGGYRF